MGAGTVINADQFAAAVQAGSKFVVSPGLTEEVVKASRDSRVPILPGVATASEIMQGLALGLFHLQILPGRNQRRRARHQGAGRAFPAGSLLPHRRHRRQESVVLSVAAQCDRGGRFLDGAVRSQQADAFARAAVMAREAHSLGPRMTSAICIGECMVELRPVDDGHLKRGFAGDAYNTAVYLKRSAPDIDVGFSSPPPAMRASATPWWRPGAAKASATG